MHVAELWRYPVKSLAGERLTSAELRLDGVTGDRIYQVRGADGRIVDARAHPKMLALHPTLDSDGELRIDGKPWDTPAVSAAIEDAAAVGPGTRLVRREDPGRFDILPLLIATDGAAAALAADHRRLRPNILLGGVDGLAEREWEGGALRIGDALVGVLRLRGRCVMTSYDPDTQEPSPEVFQRIKDRFDGKIALDCWVIRPGTIRVGDPVAISDREAKLPREVDWGRYASERVRATLG
jgi:uncharacterized protein YcbX